MGQCCSAPTGGSPSNQQAAPAGDPHTLQDRCLHPEIASGSGISVAVSQARCAGGGAAASTALVHRTPDSRFLLVALFEGLGPRGAAIAAFCRSHVADLHAQSSPRHPDSPLDALKDCLTSLDAAIFAADQLPHAVRDRLLIARSASASANLRWGRLSGGGATARLNLLVHASSQPTQAKVDSGASGCVVLLELSTQRCYCANVGSAMCLLSRISGELLEAISSRCCWLGAAGARAAAAALPNSCLPNRCLQPPPPAAAASRCRIPPMSHPMRRLLQRQDARGLLPHAGAHHPVRAGCCCCCRCSRVGGG